MNVRKNKKANDQVMTNEQNQNDDLFNKMLNIVTKLQVDFGFDDIYQSSYDEIEEKTNFLNKKITTKMNEWYYKFENSNEVSMEDSDSN